MAQLIDHVFYVGLGYGQNADPLVHVSGLIDSSWLADHAAQGLNILVFRLKEIV
jgi:hypothetical protein